MFSKTLIASSAVALLAVGAAANAADPEVIGIPRAVQLAESTSGGRALEADLDYERGRLVYEVTTASGRGVQEVILDAMTGEVVAEHPKRVDSAWRRIAKPDQLNAVKAGGAPLSQLLTKVESERNSRVSEVSLERERGQTFYEVELADGGRKMLIDPRTGAIRPGRFDD